MPIEDDPPDAPAGRLVNLSETLAVKAGNVFAVTGRDGSLGVDAPHPLGLYRDDCRHLSGHELLVGGARPLLLVASAPEPERAVHELTNPALVLPDGTALAVQALEIRMERRVAGPGEVVEEFHLRSASPEPVELEVRLRLAADLEDVLVVRGYVPRPERPPATVDVRPGGVRFARRGADGVERATAVTATPAPDAVDADGALSFRIRTGGGAPASLRVAYVLEEGGGRPADGAATPPPAPAVEADDQLFARILARSLDDVRLLRSSLDGEPYVAAGLPWYATLFGRDALITALQLAAFDPGLAAGTLRLLGRRLGTRHDPVADEAPGKVLHELRAGEAAAAGLVPARYYGSVDATPLWLCLLAEHAAWTGDLALFRELRPGVDAALEWLEGPGDADGDGLLDYAAGTPAGLFNQGWRDSGAGVPDGRGEPLRPPVTLVEPQGYAILARHGIAGLLDRDGDPARAAALRAAADAHAARLEAFWLAGRGCYAIGFGADREPSPALASNQGHLLWATGLPPARAAAVRDAVMGPGLFSGWGVRTLGEEEPGYNAVGYHLGTVWPHDTAMIGWGLRRHGFDADFTRLFDGLLEAAAVVPGHRLPELFAGFARSRSPVPVPYPVACQPQAWAAGAVPSLLTAGLGLVPEGLDGRLRVRRPLLPTWVDRLDLRGLRVGPGHADLRFARGADGEVGVEVLRTDGSLEVVVEDAGQRGSAARQHAPRRGMAR